MTCIRKIEVGLSTDEAASKLKQLEKSVEETWRQLTSKLSLATAHWDHNWYGYPHSTNTFKVPV
jgi:hypothetical protein